MALENLIDGKAIAKLSAEDRAIVLEEVQAAFDRIDAASRKDNAEARATLAKLGVEFIAPTAAEAELWRDIGERAERQLLAEGEFTPAVLQAIRDALAQHRAGQGGTR